MPNITKYKYRIWCKSCQDFTLHERVYCDEFNHELFNKCQFEEGKQFASICECNCQYSAIKISEIDKQKLEQQRKRYKNQRKQNFFEATNFVLGGMMHDLFTPTSGIETKIIESDAGLEHEEKVEKEAMEKRKEEVRQELIKYKDVGRNDKCLCGSNLKYKKCCLLKHSSLSVAYGFR